LEKSNSVRKPTKNPSTLYSHQVTPQNKSIEAFKENAFTKHNHKDRETLQKKKVSPPHSICNKYTTVNLSKVSSKKQSGSKNDYQFLYKIGSGGFGKVWKVLEKRNNRIFAMK